MALTENFNSKTRPSGKSKVDNGQTVDYVASVDGDDAEPQLIKEDSKLKVYRPKGLKDIIGRRKEVEQIKVLLKSAKKRNDVIDHILFYGPPGIGKTSLGYAIANEVGGNFYLTSGPGLTNKAELASLLTNLNQGDVLFIDEIHRLNKTLEEFLYPVLEDFRVDLTVSSGTVGNTVTLDLPKFTLIGSTTMAGSISNPLMDRFGSVMKLDLYEVDELQAIILYFCGKNNINIDDESSMEIAKRSRGTARIAIRNTKRCYDYAVSNLQDKVDIEIVLKTFEHMEIDGLGLDKNMKHYLHKLINDFDSGPVGISSLSVSINEDVKTLEEVMEPFLIKVGFIKRTSKGRIATIKGLEYLKNNE